MAAKIHYVHPYRGTDNALCQAPEGAPPKESDLLTRSPADVTCPECTRLLSEAARQAIDAQ